MSNLATQIPAGTIIWLERSRQIGRTLALSLASQAAEAAFAHGPALEIALARTQDGQAPAAPEWIQLLPAPDAAGQIVARDGRKWTLSDPAVLLAHFAAHGADLPLDLEHASELKAPKGEPAPAQAWLKELQVRDDRTVWGRPDWTADGAAAVLARHYRYVSPAMLHDDAGNITGLSSAALVTRPALRMPALAGDRRRNLTDNQDPSMNQVSLAALAGAAGLASSATEAEVLAAVTANAAAARDIKDPAKFVPAADLAAALTRATTAEGKLTEIEVATAEAAAVALVDDAIAAGKLAPASKDHWVSIARDNGDAFKSAIAAMPVVLKVTDTKKKVEGDGDAGADGLTAEQRALCAQLGVEPKAFAANLPEAK